jgi:hypothetical protein
LVTCTTSCWPSLHSLLNRDLDALIRAAARRHRDIRHMQKSGAIETDFEKSRAHAGQHAAHRTDVNVADQAATARALDGQLLQDAVLDDPRRGFPAGLY